MFVIFLRLASFTCVRDELSVRNDKLKLRASRVNPNSVNSLLTDRGSNIGLLLGVFETKKLLSILNFAQILPPCSLTDC